MLVNGECFENPVVGHKINITEFEDITPGTSSQPLKNSPTLPAVGTASDYRTSLFISTREYKAAVVQPLREYQDEFSVTFVMELVWRQIGSNGRVCGHFGSVRRVTVS